MARERERGGVLLVMSKASFFSFSHSSLSLSLSLLLFAHLDHSRVGDDNMLACVGELLRFVQDLAHHHRRVVLDRAVRAFRVVRRACMKGGEGAEDEEDGVR